MSLTTVGGRRTGSSKIGITQSNTNLFVDNAIYFGGPQNATNAFNRIHYGLYQVRTNALPVNILFITPTNANVDELVPQLEQLKSTLSRILVISINSNNEKSTELIEILNRYSIPIVNVRHWDTLHNHLYDVIKYLKTVV